jgi:CPA1 family monovalent cation:H+ antiporter
MANIMEGLSSYLHIYLELLDQQRNLPYDVNHRADFDEELIRKYLSLIDHEEYKVQQKLFQKTH